MTSLVTGGTGFIGAEVVRLLLKRGGDPVVFSRNPSGNLGCAEGLSPFARSIRASLG